MWRINKHAQIKMGFIRKNRQLIFGLERNKERDWKKYIIKQNMQKGAKLGISATFSI